MKIKYCLRGLGAGMVIAAILMGVATRDNEPLSDAQIKARAAQLGMVESGERSLADLNATTTPTVAPTEIPTEAPTTAPTEIPTEAPTTAPTEIPTEAPTTAPTETPTASPTAAPTTAPTASPTTSPTAAPTAVPATSPTAAPTTAPTVTPTPASEGDAVSITITVQRGDSSVSVSRALAESGLVADAKEFDKYLCANGYDKSISIGTYEIQMGTDEELIAKIITGKQ